MLILRVSVKPQHNGKVSIRIQGRDDAGHIFDNLVSARSAAEVAQVIEDAQKSMAVVASEITEEEKFDDKEL
jgi:hypothetical protein